MATQARGPVPKGQFGFSEEVFQYSHDMEKAKALLAEAGHPDGGFKVTIGTLNESPFREIAQSVQQRGIHEVFRELFQVGVGNAIFLRSHPELAGSRR